MLNNIIIILSILSLLPGCAWKKVQPRKEKMILRQEAYWRTRTYVPFNQLSQETIDEKMNDGLSRSDALALVLNNNPALQAHFEKLGIAKSDLVQAGLFSNPRLDTLFAFPKESGFNSDITASITMNIADLWQVPLRKKVAQDELEISTLDVLNEILNKIKKTKDLYNQLLYAQEQIRSTHLIIEQAKQIKERIIYRQQFGFTTNLDINFAEILVRTWELEILQYKTLYKDTLLQLRSLLSLPVNEESLKLTDSFIPQMPLESFESLKQFALENRPEIHIAHMKIQQAQDSINYEKSRFIKEVNVGFEYQRNDDGSKERGPTFGLDIPLFDNNYAQIARENFSLKQRKKEFRAEKSNIIKEVHATYNLVTEAQEQLVLYKQILASYKDAIAYAEKYTKSMQLNFVIMFQTYLDYYRTQQKQIETRYMYANAITDLERAIGKTLETPTNKQS